MFDLTPFTKLEVAGPGALGYMQYITGNNMDRPVGRIIYTSMLNERGGIKCDLTVTRLAEERFMVVTGGSTGVHDLQWMRRFLPEDASVDITDVSSFWSFKRPGTSVKNTSFAAFKAFATAAAAVSALML